MRSGDWAELCARLANVHGLSPATCRAVVLYTLRREVSSDFEVKASDTLLRELCKALAGVSIETAHALCEAAVQDVVRGGK